LFAKFWAVIAREYWLYYFHLLLHHSSFSRQYAFALKSSYTTLQEYI
jgi:hypothetical protein